MVSRTRSFIYNSIAAAVMQFVVLLSGFIVPRIMLVNYGSEINGLVMSITQFIGIFSIVEAGLAGASVYALYRPIADAQTKKINSILSATKRFYTRSGYAFVALTLGLALIYPNFVQTTHLSLKSVGVLVMVLGASGALEFFTMAKYRALLTADQKQYVISTASIIAIILNTIIIALMAYSGADVVTMRSVALLSVFLRSGILYLYTTINYPNISFQEVPDYEALNKRWAVLYLQVLSTVQVGTPIIIATIFTSLTHVSVYSIYNLVASGISGVLSIFTNGLTASFGDIIARNQNDVLQMAYQEFELAYYALLTWAYSCMAILIIPFINLYTAGITDVNYNVPLIGFLFTVNGLLYNLKIPQGMLISSAGLFQETRLQVTIQALIAVVSGIVLVRLWGLEGILVGSILSNIYRDIDLLFYIPRKVTKLKVSDSFQRMLRTLVLFGVIYFVFLQIAHFQIDTFVDWIWIAFITSIYSMLVVVVFNYLLDKSVFIRLLLRIRNHLSIHD